MGWYDLYQQRLRQPQLQPRPAFRPPVYQPTFVRQGGYRARFGAGTTPGGTAAGARPKSANDPIIPERIDFSLRYPAVGAIEDPAPQKSTEGDFLGSLAGAAGNVLKAINPMTAVPWLLERTHELASQFAESADDSNPLKGVAQVAATGSGAFLDGYAKVSEAIAPVMDFLPNWYKDSHNRHRAKLYSEMLTGQEQDWGPGWLDMLEVSLPGDYDVAQNWRHFKQLKAELANTQDPKAASDLKLQMNQLMDAVDLPASVKRAIGERAGRFPTDDASWDGLINEGLKEYQPGKQFSYRDDLVGTYLNIANPALWYTVETLVASRGIGAAGRGLLGGTEMMSGVETTLANGAKGIRFLEPGAPTQVGGWLSKIRPASVQGVEVPTRGLVQELAAGGRTTAAARLTQAVNVASTAGRTAARIQKYALLSGVTATGLTTMMDAIARYQGNDAAVQWFDRLNQGGEFSDNPSVQLVTGFTTNPFEAAGALKNGVVKLKHGGDAIVGKVLGNRMLRTLDADGAVDRVFAKMYRLAPDEVGAFQGDHYANRGEVFDEVVGLAADHVLDGLPSEERGLLAAQYKGDPVGRTKAVLAKYGSQIVDAIENQQDEIAQRFYRHAWEYHEYPGAFSPEVAALNAKDMRLAKGRSYEFRRQQDAVVGYAEYLQPDAATMARERIAGLPDVPMATVQDLIRQYPSLRKYWQGRIDSTAASVAREQVESMIAAAEDDFTQAWKKNPLRATTGSSPVLRPDSPTPEFDMAQGLGTTQETVEAIVGGDDAKIDLVRAFVQDKTGLTDEAAAALSNDAVWERAYKYVEDTTRPWRDAGAQVVMVEREAAQIKERLRVLYALEPNRRTAQQAARIAELESQVAKLEAERVPLRKAAAAEQRTTQAGGPAKAALDAHDAKLAPLRAELSDLNKISSGRRSAEDVTEIATLESRMESLSDLLSAAGDPLIPFGAQVETSRAMARAADRIREMNPQALTREDAQFVRDYLATQTQTHVDWSLPDSELWAAAKGVADDTASLSGHAEDMGTRAMRKVTAQRILSDIGAVDAEAVQLSPNVTGVGSLSRMFRRVEGNLEWSGGSAAATRGLRNNVARVLDRPASAGAFGPGLSTKVRAQARYVHTMSDYEVWNLLADNPELVGALDKRYRTYVENVRTERGSLRGTAPDDFIPSDYTGREGMSATDSWIEDAGGLVNRYYDLLDEADVRLTRAGDPSVRDLAGVERQAGRTDVPDVYVAEAREAIQDGVAFDPRRVIHERNTLAELARVLDDEHVTDGMIDTAVRDLTPRLQTKVIKAFQGPDGEGSMFAASTQERVDVLRRTLFPEGTPQVTSGPETNLDDLIVAGDREAVKARSEAIMAAADQVSPPVRVSEEIARVAPAIRPSHEWGRQFRELGIDVGAAPDASIMAAPGNLQGMEVLSMLNHGVLGTQPATMRRVVGLMRLLEDGTATKMGIGVPFQAEAMRVAEDLLRSHLANGKRLGFMPGVLEKGMDAARLAVDDYELALSLTGKGRNPNRHSLTEWVDIAMDDSDPLGSLQYGFKKRPKNAVIMELAEVPGLAEEFMQKRFHTVQQRVGAGKLRQVYNYVFGPAANKAYAGAVRQRFVERAAARGVDPKMASKIWSRWERLSDQSRDIEFRTDRVTGHVEKLQGDNPLYASVRNIPNNHLRAAAYDVIGEDLGRTDLPRMRALQAIPMDEVFRESESFVRRTLADAPLPLGKQLAKAYGMAAHNKAVTTLYYWLRFGLDIRYHAMNFFESQILYLGRAGFRNGEIDQGLLGMSEGVLRRADADIANNTGYAMSRSRFSYAYRTFLKEQPEALRGAMSRLGKESPEVMEQALAEMATFDPQLKDMIEAFGDSPQGYVRAMDEWHGRMLRTLDDVEGAATIEDALAQAMGDTPGLNEVYDALAKANKDTWENVRATFMGNPNRSRIERLMNSYLLFWPISYQVKAAKWLLRVMYDRVGGLPTNAGGAVLLGKLTESHREMLANDPEYRAFYEKHPTLMFIAQAMMPITPDSMGISMSPVLRNLIPGGPAKALWDIGPVWTVNHVVRPLTDEIGADVYPAVKDIPGLSALFAGLTGRDIEGYKPKFWGE